MVRVAWGLLVLAALTVAVTVQGQSGQDRRATHQAMGVGNDACAPCHKAIYDAYAATAMARTSGPAAAHIVEGTFQHQESGVSFRVYRDGTRALLSYDRSQGPELHGTQELKYFVGSNTRGRTFLFDIDGFLYQSPINYYAAKGVWDLSPGYAQLHEMELNHPVDATCLFCHSSDVQPRVTGTVNRFTGEPFRQPGVGCERCHGPGSEHVAGRGPMVNPAKLTGQRRDDVCMQCHLEGIARIATAGHTEVDYRPGDALSESLAIFVRRDAIGHGLGAVSQFEALALSACKRRSGDALTCITCHDPHPSNGSDRTASYRAKCLGCHAPLAERHHADQPDCTACHMPRLESADISHTMVTDHRIVRHEPRSSTSSAGTETLTQFGNASATPRDLGLAYGEEALRGNEFAAHQSLRLLEEASSRQQPDAEMLTRLGYLYQMHGDLDRAQHAYDQALSRDHDRGVVAANLGVLYARRGMLTSALALWRDAFDKNPQLTELGLDFANGLCDAGDAKGARLVVERALQHNPDSSDARRLLASLTDTACVRR